MTKCYLIGCRLQMQDSGCPTTGASILRATIRRSSHACTKCVTFMLIRWFLRLDHARAHDEFSGGRKVSPINRAAMMRGFDRLRRSAAVCVVAAAVCMNNALAGEDASAWDGDSRSAVRLVGGSWSRVQSTPLMAGIEIRLKRGWHTYWRYPGDAGVPPQLDFSRSRNVKALSISWPAPRLIQEHGLSVIGYVQDVILPLAVVPQGPGP